MWRAASGFNATALLTITTQVQALGHKQAAENIPVFFFFSLRAGNFFHLVQQIDK
jgi:hypothetical protein